MVILVLVSGCGPWVLGGPRPPNLAMPVVLPEEEDPFDWRVDVSPTAPEGVRAMPAVGRIVDGDGDGRIDGADVPSVAMLAVDDDRGDTQLAVVDGAGTEVGLILPTWFEQAADPLIADVTGDGIAEMVISSASGARWALEALRGTGEVVWRTEGRGGAEPCTPAAADLDGDGAVEVACGDRLFDGATGEVTASAPDAGPGGPPLLADLDQDGELEWIRGREVRSRTGDPIGLAELSEQPRIELAVTDVDGDGLGDVVGASDGWIAAWDRLGTVHWSHPLAGGPPCVADFDGDGAPEIAVATGSELRLFERDGAPVWERPYDLGDASRAGCVAVDLEGDGAYEVVDASARRIRILDGGGRERWGVPRRAGAGHVVAVADVDGDGSMELVVADAARSPGEHAGITVYGDPQWPGAPATWPSYDHGPSNVDADGRVVSDPVAPWSSHGLFRGVP